MTPQHLHAARRFFILDCELDLGPGRGSVSPRAAHLSHEAHIRVISAPCPQPFVQIWRWLERWYMNELLGHEAPHPSQFHSIMSQTKRRPCSFFPTPRGCRNGDTCPFSHDVGSNSSRPFSPPTSPNRNRDHQRSGSLTCRFWLSNGRCNRGDQCTYRHQRDAEVSEPGSSRTQLAPPLLGTDGVSNIDLTNHDIFRSLSDKPLSTSEIKAVLRGFLFDDFRFAKTFNIYAFWVPFQSAHRLNKHWVCQPSDSTPRPL